MLCPSCKAEAKLQGDMLTCVTCGPMKQNAVGEWEPCELPKLPAPADPPKPADPPAVPPDDPDEGLFVEVPL